MKPARWHLFVWIVRLVKVLVAGLTTCGLAWVWIAFYLYDERFRRRPAARCTRRKAMADLGGVVRRQFGSR